MEMANNTNNNLRFETGWLDDHDEREALDALLNDPSPAPEPAPGTPMAVLLAIAEPETEGAA